MKPSLFLAFAALAAAGLPASAHDYGYGYGYGSYSPEGYLAERLRQDGSYWAWRATVYERRSAKRAEPATPGVKTWNPQDENPWANAYGKPMSVTGPTYSRNVPRQFGNAGLCACYLPADTKSWDGGPLTAADVSRLCKVQCP